MLYPVELRAPGAGIRILRDISQAFGEDLPFYSGRGGGIRTHDPLLPKQMRYQAALRPEEARILPIALILVNPGAKKHTTQRKR